MRARTTTAGQGARRAVTAKLMVEAKLHPDHKVYIIKFRNPPEPGAGFVTVATWNSQDVRSAGVAQRGAALAD